MRASAGPGRLGAGRILGGILAAGLALAGCVPVQEPGSAAVARIAPADVALPPMRQFGATRPTPPQRSNADMAQDFLDLTFALESGRTLPVFTRFEGPITLRVTGRPLPTLDRDLDRLITRFRREAGLDIRRVPATSAASITIEVIPRSDLRRAVPFAACFVAPRVSGWAEYQRVRRTPRVDWTTLTQRERLAVFLPADVSPQETRDCLHEELAQAMGPLNDLYRLPDSVFNDDNFHAILTGFDMLMLRATHDPALRSGMTRDQVAAVIPGILARLNPAGERIPPRGTPRATPRSFVAAIEEALGPGTPSFRRRGAAERAVAIARAEGWTDVRLGFAQFSLARLSLGLDARAALQGFAAAGEVFRADPATRLQAAHVAMQLAAFALSAGDAEAAAALIDGAAPTVAAAENAGLLASMLFIKAEALDRLNRPQEAAAIRMDALGWGRYGFSSDAEVRLRAAEMAAIAPPLPDARGMAEVTRR
ncbi:MAG: DUF2927 domain-containing protein [Rhodobacteraceae bacterium]|nr:DUF2927 domain-containing protein [Paracoccaceae bacterium]